MRADWGMQEWRGLLLFSRCDFALLQGYPMTTTIIDRARKLYGSLTSHGRNVLASRGLGWRRAAASHAAMTGRIGSAACGNAPRT